MKQITTIGGGNGQGSILKHIYDMGIYKEYDVSSIFSMSDDGRTTGVLMRQFKKSFGIDLPPPGDLRRGFYALSNNKNRIKLETILEHKFDISGKISNFSLGELLVLAGGNKNDITLPEACRLDIGEAISGHKFGNILMATLFVYFEFDYLKMLELLCEQLQVVGKMFPVTTSRALIQAKLLSGEVITTQDNISNVAQYNSAIGELSLMNCSLGAKINTNIISLIEQSDIIIITPGDLFTSILSNFLFPELAKSIQKKKPLIVFMLNGNNKTGETTGFTPIDFLNVFKDTTGIIPDILIGNDTLPNLSKQQEENFKSDISVKGGEYLLLDTKNKKIIQEQYSSLEIVSGDYIDPQSLYKLNKQTLVDLMEAIKK